MVASAVPSANHQRGLLVTLVRLLKKYISWRTHMELFNPSVFLCKFLNGKGEIM
jgi:hypothetical protein